MPDARKEPDLSPEQRAERRRLAMKVLSTWAAAAKGKPPAIKKRLAKNALDMWAAATDAGQYAED